MVIRRKGNTFQLLELTLFLKGEDVLCIHALPNNCLLVGEGNNPEINVIDLAKGVVTKSIPNSSKDGGYNSFQSLIGNPNLVLVKDMKALTLINTSTLTATKLMDSIYNACTLKNSIV